MKRSIVGLAMLLPLWAAAQGLKLETGAWEMNAKGTMIPKPMLYKECVTKADLAEMAKGPDKDDSGDCRDTRPAQISGSKYVQDRVCGGGAIQVHMEFVADNPRSVHGAVTWSGKQTGSMEISGRWLGASCAGIKE